MIRYAGFTPRLLAGLIDFIVLAPFMLLSALVMLESYYGALIGAILLPILFPVYNIYFIGLWGQTIGKMAVKIRVERADGCPIDFTHAFYRHSVDLVFAIILAILTVSGFLSFTSGEYELLDGELRRGFLEKHMPPVGSTVDSLSWLWISSELVVLLFNEKRRAIHDFIAGTVVIHTVQPNVEA